MSEREQRMAREHERRRGDILSVARDLLVRNGLPGFQMEEVAAKAGYSRTALYRYFPSKEDLVVALAIETAELRVELYQRASRFDARTRERLVAFGEVTCMLYPRYVSAEVVALANAVRSAASPRRQDHLSSLEAQDDELTGAVARDAIDRGDLVLRSGLTLEEVLLGLSLLNRGVFERLAASASARSLGDPRVVMRKLGAQFLDGIGWRPLSTEWDYRQTMRRIYGELLPPQLRATLGLEDVDLPRRRRARES